MNPSDPSPSPQDPGGPQLSTTRQLTDADKLRKVICELLETERTYVKVSVPTSPPGESVSTCDRQQSRVTEPGPSRPLLWKVVFIPNI